MTLTVLVTNHEREIVFVNVCRQQSLVVC